MSLAEARYEVQPQPLTLMDRLQEGVARLAASARLQSWAGRFPMSRPIARHHATALFDLCAGFVYSQVLFAFVEAGLLDALKAGPRSPGDLTRLCSLPEASMKRLLKAATALGLAAARSHGRYGLGMRGAALAGNPGVIAMIRHHKMLYADLADPVALLRGDAEPTQTSQYWPYLAANRRNGLTADAVSSYSDLMAVSQVMIADIVAADFPFRNYRRILDVGGGTGTLLERVAARAPAAALTLFDLPSVAENAAGRLERIGLSARIQTVGGDFLADPLPAGHDLITLVRVVYDHDDDRVLQLLRACRAALPAHGALLIAEPMSGTTSDARIADAYFDFYLLAMGSGATRSPEDLGALLKEAGFNRTKLVPSTMPALVRLLRAQP